MQLKENFVLLAKYNHWMNLRFYRHAASLPPDKLEQPVKTSFGSLLGVLNHIVAVDLLWLWRFTNLPKTMDSVEPLKTMAGVSDPEELLSGDFATLASLREALDQIILAFVMELEEEDLMDLLVYEDLEGGTREQQLNLVLMQFFNHQIHHRGQVSTIFFQHGVNVGFTDLLLFKPET